MMTEEMKTVEAKTVAKNLLEKLGNPKYITAPMVEMGELSFRMLTRKYGADLCYTPMLHSKNSVTQSSYLPKEFTTVPEDRPLFAQFCGNDPDIILKAALLVQDRVDAVDLNFGCPQNIAKRGHYGSFLLEETDLLVRIVSKLAQNLTVPVTCKIRILDTYEKTFQLVLALQTAGCSLITIHGRERTCIKDRIASVNWDIIRDIKANPLVTIPIVANGGIACYEDLETCLTYTKADAVMSSEALLENAALFCNNVHPVTKSKVTAFDISYDYLELAMKYGTGVGTARAHLIKFLFSILMTQTDLRDVLIGNYPMSKKMESLSDLKLFVDSAHERYQRHVAAIEYDSLHGTNTANALITPKTPSLLIDVKAKLSLDENMLLWKKLRSESPQIGITNPSYTLNRALPGWWYMRHRKGFNWCHEPAILPKTSNAQSVKQSPEDEGVDGGDETCGAGSAPTPMKKQKLSVSS
jgi:tRNA-dihydrouridine synthase 1